MCQRGADLTVNNNSASSENRKIDGTRFVDAEDLAEAERLILSEPLAASQPERKRPQFTLGSVMVIGFFVCLGFSAGNSWVPAPVVAGVIGISAVVVLCWTAIAFPQSSRGRSTWVGITLAYVMACIMALLRIIA